MYECFACHQEYEKEEKAKNCCTQIRYFDDGDWALPRKIGKPFMTTHHCPNVTFGEKSWMVHLKVDEKCPMCDYVWRPR